MGVDHHRDIMGGEDLKRADKRRLRQSVRVDADEQRAVDTLPAAMITDCLADRQDMPFVERGGQGGAE